MIISQSDLFQKITATLLRMKREESIDPETAGTLGMLENTMNLLSAAALQLNLEAFPTTEMDCLSVIKNAENSLQEDDLEELKYLAESVRWALEVIS